MNRTGLKAACLAVGLATAWGVRANAQSNEIQLTISSSNNLTHVTFFYGENRTSLHVNGILSLPDVRAGTVAKDTFFLPSDGSSDFTLLATYDEPNKLVAFAFPSGFAPTIMGRGDFDTQFAPFTEAGVATALMSNDTAALTTFVLFNDFDPMYFDTGGDLGTLIDFSGGIDGGSVFAEIIPEPSPLVLTGWGMLAVFAFYCRHRRWPGHGLIRVRDQ
ncbi:MAG TPA: hypothetical protein VLZ30_10545 [Verrucomicrobiae bacterium]|nr:hypothetical protein [Verrucomicrobiae bacterium]